MVSAETSATSGSLPRGELYCDRASGSSGTSASEAERSDWLSRTVTELDMTEPSGDGGMAGAVVGAEVMVSGVGTRSSCAAP
eukprot:CAMPEP_0168458312 /NCGR_PEP_ID=MMETSP0228-20121227/52315_1 /TAXON_ID=133427 /ORGANISM="Protoceratium reticulatum, Strain CCCM 535 (=CCMP 1889)" /LENGTH=81 /DNA_ID=CAMNT_0008473413 /DNA_START=23 /DNA_END=265 /DNA_ORIENTATION=-